MYRHRNFTSTKSVYVLTLIILIVSMVPYIDAPAADNHIKHGKSDDMYFIVEQQNGHITRGNSVAVRPAKLGEQDRRVTREYKSRIEPIYLRKSGVPCYSCTGK